MRNERDSSERAEREHEPAFHVWVLAQATRHDAVGGIARRVVCSVQGEISSDIAWRTLLRVTTDLSLINKWWEALDSAWGTASWPPTEVEIQLVRMSEPEDR